MITTILFDLDGTLLPMDMDTFLKAYMGSLAVKLAGCGYEPRHMIETIWKGTAAMIRNDGTKTNEAVLWDLYTAEYGEGAYQDKAIFEDFYQNEFQLVQQACGYAPEAAEAIRKIKDMGFRVVLATNPLFPEIATYSRIRWAGLNADDFDLITTYENSCHCKPNPAYFQDVLAALDLTAEECVMVGNDTSDDMCATALGIPVFFLTHSLINKSNVDITAYPHGNFQDLLNYIEGLNK